MKGQLCDVADLEAAARIGLDIPLCAKWLGEEAGMKKSPESSIH
jgi:hypothetical protein